MRAFLTLLTLCAFSSLSHASPVAVYWYDDHPGLPPKALWEPGDTTAAILDEMAYSQMRSRPGSPEHFRLLKEFGFGAVGLSGFDGPYDPLPEGDVWEQAKQPDHKHTGAEKPFDPDDDSAANLDPVHQTRNARYYCRWAREAGLEVYLLTSFWGRGHASDAFDWGDEQWVRIGDYVRRMARFAKRHQCAGLIFDFEPYSIDHTQWSLTKCMEKQGLSRGDALALMRRRGAEMAAAIAGEFPECILQVYGMGNATGISAQDGEDVWRAFFTGLCDAEPPGGVHSNDAYTYYWSDPDSLSNIYHDPLLKNLESVRPLLKDPAYLDRCSVSLGTAFMNRWFTWDGMYWRAVSVYREEDVRRITLSLRHLCPKYFWLCGDWVSDWLIPETAEEMQDPVHLWGVGSAFRNLNERSYFLSRAFRDAMAIPDDQVEAEYRKMLDGRTEFERADMARRDPRLPGKRVAVLYHEYIEAWCHPDDQRRQARVWDLHMERDPDFERVVADLAQRDIVVSAFSQPPKEDMTRFAGKWREWLQAGGVLVIADAAKNPRYAAWLEAISPKLALPADFGGTPGLHRAVMADCELTRGPSRLDLATWDIGWKAVPEGWTVAAKSPEAGLPVYVYRRFGKGVVAALLCHEQHGFNWRHLENLVLLAGR